MYAIPFIYLVQRPLSATEFPSYNLGIINASVGFHSNWKHISDQCSWEDTAVLNTPAVMSDVS